MKNKFNVGDKVRILRATDGNKKIINKVGVIKRINGSRFATIEFNEHIGGHSGCGDCKQGFGWDCDFGTFELVKTYNKLIFRDNATILFKDGKRYVAKCEKGEKYDKEKGLLVCLAKAHGYNFKDLQEMLAGAEEQGKVPSDQDKYPQGVSKEVIVRALKIIGKNGISFNTEDEVKEFYELIKGKFKINHFNYMFSVGTKYFSYYADCDWLNIFDKTYTYTKLKETILELLGE